MRSMWKSSTITKIARWDRQLDREVSRMTIKKLRPVHPGDILRHDFMEPLKLSSYKLAKELGISRAGLIMKVEKYGLDKRKLAR